MEAAETRSLLDLYQHLREKFIESEGKPPQGSILLGLIGRKSKNDRMRILLDAAVPIRNLGASASELLRTGLADHTGTGTEITLTAKGIWEAEVVRSIVDCPTLVEFIDTRLFDCFADSKVPPNDKEKLILFCLLASRAFSADTAVIPTKDGTQLAWRDLVLSSSEFLTEHEIIKNVGVQTSLASSSGGTTLPPLVNFFRYSEHLPTKTGAIFVAKSSSYYLDLVEQGQIEKARLAHLFGLILGSKVTFELTALVASFCRTLAYDTAVKVYEPGARHFASIEYDSAIESALRDLALRT